jgi:hypothetical protein
MITISDTYAIKYCLSFAPNYKWLENDICYNIKSGRIIKKVLCGGSIGYVINGRFRSLKYLRQYITKEPISSCPF